MPCSTRFAANVRKQTSLRDAVLPTSRTEYLTRHADGANEDADNDDDDDADSSANEYAEGLGCADRKRCRERPSSGFEFDNHPREEYFSQPAPNRDATGRKLDLEEVPAAFTVAKRRALSGHVSSSETTSAGKLPLALSGHVSSSETTSAGKLPLALLKELERQECGPTTAIDSGPRFPQPRSMQNGNAVNRRSYPNRNTIAMVQGLCAQLVELRTSAETVGVDAAASGSGHRALAVLAALEGIRIDTVLLRQTGVGKELSLPAWRQNPTVEVANRSIALVNKWRTAVLAPDRSSSTGGA